MALGSSSFTDNTVQDAPLKLTLETIDGLLKTITAVEVKGEDYLHISLSKFADMPIFHVYRILW